MTTNPLKVLALCAAAMIGFASGASAATISGIETARLERGAQSNVVVIPVARRGHYQGNRWSAHRGRQGYRVYRGRQGYQGYRGYRGRHGYRGYYGWRGGYRGWGYPGYYGPNIYIAPYGYYDDGPTYYSAPPAGNRCAYWHRQCVKNWGSGNSNYYGCMRYEKCAP